MSIIARWVGSVSIQNIYRTPTSFPQLKKVLNSKLSKLSIFFDYVMEMCDVSILGSREGFWASRGGWCLDNIILDFCQIFLDFLSNILSNKSSLKKQIKFFVKLLTGVICRCSLKQKLKSLKYEFNRGISHFT